MKFGLKELESSEKSRNNSLTLNFADLLSFPDSLSEDTQSKTLTTLNAKHLQLTPYTKHGYILYIYLIQTIELYVKRHLKQEGHDGPVSLHWLIREIHSYQTLHYLGIGLKHKTPYKD